MFEPVLDPAQLRRIESTHRGFGYQHLYAVACLLDMAQTETKAVVIERDEDVELIRADVHVYIQVKTRSRALRSSDIDSALRRFGELRAEHRERRRTREVRFAVVSNVAPGPELAASLSSAEWPDDVAVVWPGQPGPAELMLPPASPDLATAVEACIVQAELIPFGSLAPETLTLKLAGLVQYVATGHLDHRITVDQVTEFFEQLVLQLQEFPEPPANYRPQLGEPPLISSERVRLLVGVSGAGKTAWAARAAALHEGPAVYFDVGELPPSAVASSLARELAARFLSNVLGAGGAALPTASGLELFAAISDRLAHSDISVVIVLDNVHRLPIATVRNLVEIDAELRFVLLGQQPWVGQLELEALLGIKAWTLAGWSLDAIISTFAATGCPLAAATGESMRQVTAGVPLYVESAAQVTKHSYGGDANARSSTLSGGASTWTKPRRRPSWLRLSEAWHRTRAPWPRCSICAMSRWQPTRCTNLSKRRLRHRRQPQRSGRSVSTASCNSSRAV